MKILAKIKSIFKPKVKKVKIIPDQTEIKKVENKVSNRYDYPYPY